MLKDSIILILGGTGDVGLAITSLLEKEGAIVLRHGRSGEYAADINVSEETARMIAKIIQKFGKIDAVINSLSAPTVIGVGEKKIWNNFLEHLNVQLKAAIEVTEQVIPEMKKQKSGRIINILTSYVVGDPPAGLSDYITAKYALLGFTKALAKELGRYGIAVSAVSPSIMKNSFTKNLPPKIFELEAAQSPTGKLTTEEDIAKAVLHLLTSNTEQINGKNILIVGGQSTIIS